MTKDPHFQVDTRSWSDSVRHATVQTLPKGTDDERGFTLIEILVVILIIGILAAIAVPSFLNQRSKANDAGAKVVARTAETAIESYATGNGGSYSGATLSALRSIEPTLITASTSVAFLQNVSVSATGYTLTTYSPTSSDTFSIVKSGNSISRSCSGSGGGCPSGGTW
jgi:type IV pilus assembly protein PilA